MSQPAEKIRQQIPAMAKKLEQRLITGRLLSHMFPGFDPSRVPMGRYNLLSVAISANSQLREVLVANRTGALGREWKRLMAQHQGDAHFLHAIAVIYREQARWTVSTPLWAVLLSSREFWTYFSDSRFVERGSGRRRDLTEDEQCVLLNELVRVILSVHRTQGAREFAAGNMASARVHLGCLDVCRCGGEALLSALDEQGQACKLTFEAQRLQRVREIADDLLDDWCAALVREAEKEASDPEAIRNLAEGIRKNYKGGILRLQPFIDLKIPVNRVLHKSLHWYNDWCYDLYVKRDLEGIRTILNSARTVADQLIPRCTQGRDFEAANQVLSQHFLLRGFAHDGPLEGAIDAYKEALRWNAANTDARQLLGGVVRDVLMERLEIAAKCAKRHEYREAHEVLDSLDKEMVAREAAAKESVDVADKKSIDEDKATLRDVRAFVYFNHAQYLADQGSFRAAFDNAEKARRMNPQQEVIKKFHAEMRELAPEEDNLRHLREANEAINEERFDLAITAAEKVAAKSKFRSNARHVLAGAYFRRGVAAANNEKFESAHTDLERSLGFCDEAKDKAIIRKQLDVVRQVKVGLALRQAVDRKDWPKAEQLLRGVLEGQLSAEEKKNLQSQLSAILNAHAVGLLNITQEKEKRFGDVITEIVTTVKQHTGVNG
jgi:tetratricopeptide (TPR) repeat protein